MSCPVVRDSTLQSHRQTVDRVITAMRNQIDQPLSLESMARIGFSSPFHLNRTFRQVTGVPPSQFLSALRLEAARRMLMKTQRKVIDICYDVGYNSVGTFTRRFTSALGVSPTTFRELTQSPAARAVKRPDCGAIAGRKRRSGPGVAGQIAAPGDFEGIILAGLFETPIPQAKPVACVIIDGAGDYEIEDVPEGNLYLFALGLEHPVHPPVCFQHETALRGGGHSIRITGGTVKGTTYIQLRPPSSFDPPILMALTLLLDQLFDKNGVDDQPLAALLETGP